MTNPHDIKRDDARRRAEDKRVKAAKREAAIVAYQTQRRESELAKIARLRALREARDLAAAAVAQRETPPKAASARPKRAKKIHEAFEHPAAGPDRA
jgi:hypothetical protein